MCVISGKFNINNYWGYAAPPSEIVFQEQSYSCLHSDDSGWSLAWDHFRSDIDDPCSIIADPCDVTIPEAIGGRALTDA